MSTKNKMKPIPFPAAENDHFSASEPLIDSKSLSEIYNTFITLTLDAKDKERLEKICEVCEKIKGLLVNASETSSSTNFKQLVDHLNTSYKRLSECFAAPKDHVGQLFDTTARILNALRKPDLSNKKIPWTKEKYNDNLHLLNKLATVLSTSDCEDFKNIAHAIRNMSFTIIHCKTRKKPHPTRSVQGFCGWMCTHYLLPSLGVLAYTLMIASIVSLICFIAIALLPQVAILLSPYLVASGLSKALISLATLIGCSAPTSTSSLGLTGSLVSMAGLGFGYTVFNAQTNQLEKTHASIPDMQSTSKGVAA